MTDNNKPTANHATVLPKSEQATPTMVKTDAEQGEPTRPIPSADRVILGRRSLFRR